MKLIHVVTLLLNDNYDLDIMYMDQMPDLSGFFLACSCNDCPRPLHYTQP